jgi:hypothetical protein
MAAKRKTNDLWNMKTFRLLSLVGITSIALTQAAWAGNHGGGGGGFHGGGGFGGGHGGGGGVAHGGSLGFGVGSRGGGVGFGGPRVSSFGTRPSYRQPVYSSPASRFVTPSVRTTTASNRQRNQFGLSGNRTAQVSRPVGKSVTPSARATTASNHQQNHVGSSGGRGAQVAANASGQRALSARNHVFGRHDGNWHQDWDRRHAHYSNGHWWCYDGGTWIGLDAGFYPWDYFPYYAYDYYPYDYYAGDNGGASSYVDQNVDPTVTAVQSELTNLGYYHGVIDGRLGPDTRSALTRYQIDHHLSVTGSLSSDTLQSLGLPRLASI